ncbi:hypothetical protein RND71_029050 [Anisodus tanguticus]|uniref:Uncharacterized protein n=1 Tax=Anisodus tanguticus TaxID=243964 RepID=A0AAE1RF93_9SOLA|nr:hypothetical protein RND71_029050 [Anisodus tanguticus]
MCQAKVSTRTICLVGLLDLQHKITQVCTECKSPAHNKNVKKSPADMRKTDCR